MFGLSNTAGYAIQALGCLGEQQESWVLTKTIAARTGIPGTYLSKILNSLSKSGLILAKRGYQGGFKLVRPAAEINLLMVVEAMDGKIFGHSCLLGLPQCTDKNRCPAHDFWNPMKKNIKTQLEQLTLDKVAEYEKGLPWLHPQEKTP